MGSCKLEKKRRDQERCYDNSGGGHRLDMRHGLIRSEILGTTIVIRFRQNHPQRRTNAEATCRTAGRAIHRSSASLAGSFE